MGLKAKGAYAVKRAWYQDHSSLIVPKAVQAFVLKGTPMDMFIYRYATDAFDFMQSVKVPRASRLEWGNQIVQNTCRYYIAMQGQYLTKIMPPLSGDIDERRLGVDVGWMTQLCNDANDFDWHNLNRRWYLTEAEKLLAGLGLG